MDIKYWLRKSPQPAVVLCDGKKIQVGTGPRKWAEMAETISSMGGVRLECLAADGTILRVTDVEAEPDKPAGSTDSGGPARMPVGISDMAQLAIIIGNVCDAAARRHEAAYKMAFDSLSDIVKSNTDRTVAMEAAWIESLNHIAALRMQLADAMSSEKEDGLSEILSQAAGGFLAGKEKKKLVLKPRAKVNGHSNGAD